MRWRRPPTLSTTDGAACRRGAVSGYTMREPDRNRNRQADSPVVSNPLRQTSSRPTVRSVETHHRQPSPALIKVKASASADLADIQVDLLRRLCALLKVAGAPAGNTVCLDASIDQVEASVREIRHLLQHADIDTGT
jgi:hypothetical protein